MKLNVRRNKELELKIVNLTDLLIQSVIEASLKDPEEKPLVLEEAEDLILQLSELIHDLIEDEQHLESMLSQLVFQKLPGDHILEGFKDFNEVLSALIEKGVHNYRSGLDDDNSVDEAEIPTKANKDDINKEKDIYISKIDNGIESLLKEATSGIIDLKSNADIRTEDDDLAKDRFILDIKKIYPDLVVYKNINYKGTKFQYYIPERKIAIEMHTNPQIYQGFKGIKEFISEKQGIKIIKIPTKYTISSLKSLIKF